MIEQSILRFFGCVLRPAICADCECYEEEEAGLGWCVALGGIDEMISDDHKPCRYFSRAFDVRSYFIEPTDFNEYANHFSKRYDAEVWNTYKKWAERKGYDFNEQTYKFIKES